MSVSQYSTGLRSVMGFILLGMLDLVRPLGWAAATIALTAMLAGCADDAEPTPDPTPSPTAPPSAEVPPLDPAAMGGEGLDIRYLDSDGKIKTLKVKDFPR
jgi:hypothetical protein